MKDCLFTNDVETTSIWFNSLRPETGIKVIQEGMPLLLELYSRYNIKTTFFVVGDFAQQHPEVVRMVIPFGHEIGSHGFSHDISQAFDTLPFMKQVEHLSKSKKILEDISGQEVISFRAPALRVNKSTSLALLETGYKIDSSVPSQRFDFFLSFGSLNKLKWILAPRLPYFTKPDDLTRKGNGPLIEVPLSSTFFPYVGTTMRIFPVITRIQHHLLYYETLINSKPVVFDIHPNEFIDESNEKRIVNRRTNNPVKYLFADLIRSQLKIKNLGIKALPLYEREIRFYQNKGFRFISLRDYCEKNNLLK